MANCTRWFNQRKVALARAAWALAAVHLGVTPGQAAESAQHVPRDAARPNVVLILADDLGYGEVGYQAQSAVSTPNIDRLAAEGLRFTQHYSGSAVCAPSRCALMTGRHTGHCSIRDNIGIGPDGGEIRPALASEDITVAEIFKKAGYVTGAIGKWGLGDESTPGVPWEQGFDRFFGYLHNTHGTRYYTEFVYRNAEKIALPGNYGNWRKQYGPDLCLEEAKKFLRENRAQPFFLYYPLNLVHGAYIDPPPNPAFPPIVSPSGDTYTEKERNYLRMIQRLDHDVGQLVAQIDELNLGEKTLILFTSDNGTSSAVASTKSRHQAAGDYRGGKGDLYEGGIRVPFVARWSGVIKPGTSTNHSAAFWDLLPTVCELVGEAVPSECDGLSYLPTLHGQPQAAERFLYWELAKRDEPQVLPKQAVLRAPWKLVIIGDTPPELYHLTDDPREMTNLAASHRDIVADLRRLMTTAHQDHPAFPLAAGPGFE